jgi:hypothetical protein
MICSNCGDTVGNPLARFCAFCGNPMQTAEAAATQPQSPELEDVGKRSSPTGTALLIPARCSLSHQWFLIRMMEANPGTWTVVAASPIAEERLRNPEFQRAEANGRLAIGKDYDGCPHCKRRGLFLHRDCGSRLCCCDLNAQSVVCPWCGKSSEAQAATTATLRGLGDR